MSRAGKIPSLRHHKPSNRAVVTIDGQGPNRSETNIRGSIRFRPKRLHATEPAHLYRSGIQVLPRFR